MFQRKREMRFVQFREGFYWSHNVFEGEYEVGLGFPGEQRYDSIQSARLHQVKHNEWGIWARGLFFCGDSEEGKLLFVRLEFPGEQRKMCTKLNLGNQVKLSGV